jgi:AcrR family transcriptional regulator
MKSNALDKSMTPARKTVAARSRNAAGRETGAGAPAADAAVAEEPEGAGARWSGRSSPKRSRRDAILKSVASVLRDSRLSSLTMQDIAHELGITKGNLYYYFRDKQDILYQCHMQCMEVSLEVLREVQAQRATARPGTVQESLRSLLMGHMRGILENGFGNVLLTDLDNLSPPQRRRYVAKRDEFETGVREMIAAGVATREFDCPDVKLASISMLGAINWIPKWYHPGGGMSPIEVAAGMADFLMRALRAGGKA